MYSYCAVRTSNSAGIYKCAKGDDVEVWKLQGKPVFPDFETALHFETQKELKIGQELIVLSFEIHDESPKQRAKPQLIEVYFNNFKDMEAWINKKINEISGHGGFKPPLDHYWMEEYIIGNWGFYMTVIVGRVKPDPRNVPWQVKFELCGLKYQIAVDPVQSGFEDYYINHISPWLEDVAAAEDKILTDDEEIKRQVLPILTKILVLSGPGAGFSPDFYLSKAKEICDALMKNFELFVL